MHRSKIIIVSLTLIFMTNPCGAQNSSSSNQENSPVASRAKPSLQWIKKQFALPNPAAGYSTAISYPFFTGLSTEVGKANSALQVLLLKTAREDQKQYLDYTADKTDPTAIAARKQKDGSSLAGTFKVHKTTDNLISVSFSLTSYYYGIAHPNNYYVTFNYQLVPPTVITLSTLSKKQPAFLQAIARSCAKQLQRKFPDIDQTNLAFGTKPINENFQNFVLTDHQIKFYFSDDQITAHARPIEEPIGVSYSQLKHLLDATSAAYALAR
jgi:hypothetical protein